MHNYRLYRMKEKTSKVFDIQDFIKLTEVQRTAKENPIINVVTDIRNNLDSPVDVFKRGNDYK